MSLPFSLDKADRNHILKVAAYTIGSTVCAALIALVAQAEVSEKWLFVVPFINIVLVAAQKFFQGEKQVLP